MATKHQIKFKKFAARTVALYNATCTCGGWKSTGGLNRYADISAQADRHLAETTED